jgi:hypothetical protein
VKGFHNSESHTLWTDCLIRCGYSWRQFLLSPFQFRVPNGRTRFYMAIHLDSRGRYSLYSQDKSIVNNSIRSCNHLLTHTVNGKNLDCSYLHIDHDISKAHELGEDDITGPSGVNSIAMYLESSMAPDVFDNIILSDDILSNKWAEGLSIVGAQDRCTFCFTSSYSQVTHHRMSQYPC